MSNCKDKFNLKDHRENKVTSHIVKIMMYNNKQPYLFKKTSQ
jgi:hypothetical protein